MEFRILGPLEVAGSDGRRVPIGGPRQRALLALLLLRANEPVSVDRLIEELWGEGAPAGAVKAVQVGVSRLRRALEGGGAGDSGSVLVSQGGGYLLRLGPGELDAERFERLLEEGRQELSRGTAERAAERLRDALALWRGPPLGDVAYESFAQGEIARLGELRLAALEERVDADLALGRHAAVVGELERLATEHPLRERLQGQLMLALYRSGRQADALAAYRRTRGALVEELGLDPGRALQQLERAILIQDPTLDAERGSDERPARRRPASTAAFVGREPEMEALRSALGDALNGSGRLVVLEGEPGIGKSRLADELASEAEERGAQVRWGRCWEAGGAPPYWPWVQPIRSYVRDCELKSLRVQLGPGGAELAQLVPELRELLPDLPEPLPVADEGARFRLFDATAGFLRTIAGSWPLVLVLDDLHAADAPSLLLLRFVARELRGARILIVAAYREQELAPDELITVSLAELARTADLHLALGALTRMDIARFIAQTMGTEPAERLVAAVADATEGNPLFVVEIVRLLAAEGRLAQAGRDGRSLGLPRGVRQVIAGRLGRLSSTCRGVLAIASVLGREFAVDDLAPLSGLERAALLDHLDEAAIAGVVSVVPSAAGQLRFTHALVRDSLYEQLPPARRARLHQRVGAALEAFPHTRSAQLAHHFLRALPEAPLDSALEHAGRAAEEAMSLLAYEEAARLYELALAALALSRGTREVTRCELLLALGAAQVRAGDGARAKEAFLEAAAIARRLQLTDHLARAALGFGGRFVWARAGSDEQLVSLLEEALAAGGAEETELQARVHARLAAALRDEPDRGSRSELSRRGIEIARRVGDLPALAYALAGRYAAVWWAENARERLALADELIALAEAIGDRERAVEGHGYRMHALLELGEPEAARAELEIRGRLTSEMRQPVQLWIQLSIEAMWRLFLGRLDDAEERIRGALELGRHAQPHEAHAMHQLQLFALRREQRRLGEIEDTLAACARAYPWRPVLRCALAVVHFELGHAATARDLFAELAVDDFAGLPPDNDWLFEMTLLAEVCEFLDDADRAGDLYQHMLPYASANVVGVSAEITTGAAARHLGKLASTLQRYEIAALHFDQAIALNTRSAARPWVAHTQHDYARMLLARDAPGDRDAAHTLLADALATCSQLGMAALAAKASTLPRPSAGTPTAKSRNAEP